MLGEILGSSAGEAVTDPCRFLLPRGASCGVLLAVGVDVPGPSIGLWLADVVPGDLPNAGDGIGAMEGVFPDAGSPVMGWDCAGAPSGEKCCSSGRFVTDSGSWNIVSTGSVGARAPSLPLGDAVGLRVLADVAEDDGDDDGSFMREAGVAGEGMAARGSAAGVGADDCPFPFDVCLPLVALGGGSGGGGISDRFSGETELFSSISSRLIPVTLGLFVRLLEDVSTASLSTWFTIDALAVFRR